MNNHEKLRNIPFGVLVDKCNENAICSSCPLYRKYPLFYNKYTNYFEYCLAQVFIDVEARDKFLDEDIELFSYYDDDIKEDVPDNRK